MDCHDVRSLLAFTRHDSDQIDATGGRRSSNIWITASTARPRLNPSSFSTRPGPPCVMSPFAKDGKAELLAKLDREPSAAVIPSQQQRRCCSRAALAERCGWMRPLRHLLPPKSPQQAHRSQKGQEWFKTRGRDGHLAAARSIPAMDLRRGRNPGQRAQAHFCPA